MCAWVHVCIVSSDTLTSYLIMTQGRLLLSQITPVNATWPLHGEAHDTHYSKSFCGVSRRLVYVPTIQVLQDVGWREEEEGQQ